MYVALLRGINVGGNNLIKMVALRACFEAQGFRDVATYIQSGNVLFAAREPGCRSADPTDRRRCSLRPSTTRRASCSAVGRRCATIVEPARRPASAREPASVPVRCHLPEGARSAPSGHEERAHEGGRGPGARRRRRALLLEARSARRPRASSARSSSLPDLPEHDHPQLEHDDGCSGSSARVAPLRITSTSSARLRFAATTPSASNLVAARSLPPAESRSNRRVQEHFLHFLTEPRSRALPSRRCPAPVTAQAVSIARLSMLRVLRSRPAGSRRTPTPTRSRSR